MFSLATATLDDLLALTLEKKGSDLHIAVGAPPQIRVDGVLVPVGTEKVDTRIAENLCFKCLSQDQMKKLKEEWEMDLAIPFKDNARFRVNLSYQQNTVAGVFREIPRKIPKAETLGIPEVAVRLTEKPRGLVLVTGPTGSGKSTTLASMIDRINENRPEHIITVEDPIEFIHESKKSLIVQREVEKDTHSFPAALKRILRQDPDVVLIGEMRDLETIAAAITIAETGHLVFATLHTNTAVQTIDRIIDVFPSTQQGQIRAQLAFILEGVLSQQLLPKQGGGRCLAMEIFMPTIAIRNLIRESKIHQLYASMQMDQKTTGMQTMNQSLKNLVAQGKITRKDAFEYCTEMEEMKRLLPA